MRTMPDKKPKPKDRPENPAARELAEAMFRAAEMQPRGQFDTGVDAGRNDAALKRAELGRPGRLRVRSLAAHGLAVVLLAAFAALLALPLQAQAQATGICGRTEAVRNAILGRISGVDNCADVTATHLAAITSRLAPSGQNIADLKAGDFAGLTALTYLDLNGNDLTTPPAEVFDGLTELTTLPAGVFDELTALTWLALAGNPGAPFAPTADALPDDGTVSYGGGTVTLDGSGSDGAPWGANVTDHWTLTNPSSGVTVTFDDAARVTPEVTTPALAEGAELTFTLTVAGRGGAFAATTTAPMASASSVTTNEDTAYTFVAADFNFADSDGDALASVTVVTLPWAGSLTHDDTAVTMNQVVTKADIDANKLVFTPASDGSSAASTDTDHQDITIVVVAVTDNDTGICGRTAAVRNAVTFLEGAGISALKPGNLSHLTSLRVLGLANNDLTTLAAAVFCGLSSLQDLCLWGNPVDPLLLAGGDPNARTRQGGSPHGVAGFAALDMW